MSFQTRPSLLARLRDCTDEAAWREFIASYGMFIRKVATDAGAPRDTLADMAQDVFLTVVRVLPGFTYDRARGRFRHWLARVVRSRCTDALRLRRRDRRLGGRVVLEPTAAPQLPNDNIAEQRMRDVMETIRRSTRPETWQCFERHALQGRKAAEVAQELQTTENAVYLNCARLVRRIRAECRRQQAAEAGE